MSFIHSSRRTAAATPAAPAGDSTAAEGTAGAMAVRPGAGIPGLQRGDARPPAAAETSSQGTLIVGEGIQVKGEIQSCTTLVVEGRVEASLEAEELTVREGGVYDGKAVVETARIAGDFSGELTVRGLLTISAGGGVSGSLRYGDLRIEQGGRLSGDVDLLTEEAQKPDVRDATQAAARAAVGKAQAEGRAKAATEAASEKTTKEMIAR